jgi:RNA polymerase sigma-70 factor (ECF subfamily)
MVPDGARGLALLQDVWLIDRLAQFDRERPSSKVVMGLIRGAEELTDRHEAAHFAQIPKDDLRIDLVRALESLPEMYREVILLRDMEQLTTGEVADCLAITREACKSRIHRGRVLLREYLQTG